MELDEEGRGPPLPKYNEHLSGPLITAVSVGAPKARVHSTEWAKVMAGARPRGTCAVRCASTDTSAGEPVEINPSVGAGYKVMTVAEYTSRWKRCVRLAQLGVSGGSVPFLEMRRDPPRRVTSAVPPIACTGTATSRTASPAAAWIRRSTTSSSAGAVARSAGRASRFARRVTAGRGGRTGAAGSSALACTHSVTRPRCTNSDPDFLLPEEYEKLKWDPAVMQAAK